MGLYRWVKASERLPDYNKKKYQDGEHIIIRQNDWACSAYIDKETTLVDHIYHDKRLKPELVEWLEKIEADQQDLWDDVKIAFAKDIAAILSGVNSEPVNVNEIISKYFLIPKQ